MPDARLEVTDALGRRIVPIGKEAFGIGRRETNDLRLGGSEVAGDHAEIVAANGGFLVRDKQSRYGTYVNDEAITERTLAHGDRIRLGRSGGAELVFLLADTTPAHDKAATTAIGDLRQIAALLDGLRALGSGRVLDDVLALVLDSAIEVTGAERGFIMLATAENELEFKLARGPPQPAALGHQLRDQPQDPGGGVPHRRAENPRRPPRRRARQRAHGRRGARHPQRAVRAAEAGTLRRSRGRCRGGTADRRAVSRLAREGIGPVRLDAPRATA